MLMKITKKKTFCSAHIFHPCFTEIGNNISMAIN